MEEPFFYSLEPDRSFYGERTKDIIIYESSEPLKEYNDLDHSSNDEKYNSYIEELYKYDIHRFDQPKIPDIPISDMNLQKLMDLIPNGVELSDIKMECFLDHSDLNENKDDRKIVRFFYTKTFPANFEQYEKDIVEYKKAYIEFENKKKEYEKLKNLQKKKRLRKKVKKETNSSKRNK